MILDEKLLKNTIKEHKFICWDCETESLSLAHARPWEISWNVYNGYNKIESHQYFLNWPDLNVSKGAADATGFNHEKVKKEGKNPKEVIDLFNTYLYNKEYQQITQNGLGYDVYVHNTSMLNLGYKTDYSYINRMYDTLPIARAYRLGMKAPENKEDFLAWQYRFLCIFKKGLKCKNFELAKEFGYEVDESRLHQGIYDCELTAFTFFNLIKKLDIQ